MVEFVDREHEAAREFERIKSSYKEGDPQRVKADLEALIGKDPFYFEPYILLSEIYELEGNIREAEEVLTTAYQKALDLISEDGKLPDRLEWKHPTNRHIIEVFVNLGILYWELGEIDRALKIFKEIYRMNPQDEPGVRFYILAILEGMSFEEFEQVFSREGDYDYEDLSQWFEKHSKDYPEVFN